MDKEKFLEEFNRQQHRLGRIMLISAALLLLAVPFMLGAIYGAFPDFKGFINGFIKVGIVYIPVGIVEFLVYAPMLGNGGSYLTFLTGNVTNLKIPCAMNARDIAKTEVGTAENEIISTLSVASSSIVTMLVIFAGVLLLVPLTPVIVAQMKKGAYYITSGILDVKEDVVVQAVKDAGLTLVEVTHQGEWVSVTARKD